MIEASGLEARVLQHEIDHLDGVLILDRTERKQRRAALRALRTGEHFDPSMLEAAGGRAPSRSEPPREDRLPRHLRLRRDRAARRWPRARIARSLVVTPPDRRRGRGRRRQPAAGRRRGRRARDRARPDRRRERRRVARARSPAAGPGAVVVCAFGQLIREPLLSSAEMLNVHPSLLPRWRGAAPIERAIMAGDATTGVCVMRLTAGLDSGPVALREEVADRPRRRLRLARRIARRGSAAGCWPSALDLADARRPPLRGAGRGGRHLRREDRVGRAPGRSPWVRRRRGAADPRADPAHRRLRPHLAATRGSASGIRSCWRTDRPPGPSARPTGRWSSAAAPGRCGSARSSRRASAG